MAPFLPSNTIGALSSVCAGWSPPVAEPHETSATAAPTVNARMRMGMA
jgi:hypothetical protein